MAEELARLISSDRFRRYVGHGTTELQTYENVIRQLGGTGRTVPVTRILGLFEGAP